jgi:hypothetical protein
LRFNCVIPDFHGTVTATLWRQSGVRCVMDTTDVAPTQPGTLPTLPAASRLLLRRGLPAASPTPATPNA